MNSSRKKGFTLLEVLVAGSILFIVSAAVVGLSNSIIQGTALTTDQATATRLATQGIELVNKIRNDTVKGGDFTQGKFIWFPPVESASDYGWWQLSSISNNWQLNEDDVDFPDVSIDLNSFDSAKAEKISEDQLDFYRFMCIEALAASNYPQENSTIFCNAQESGNGYVEVIDGTRSEIDSCYQQSLGLNYNKDSYCEFSAESINRNRVDGLDKYIPNGNAVKVRSIVVWEDRDEFHRTEVSTMFTNWQTIGQ